MAGTLERQTSNSADDGPATDAPKPSPPPAPSAPAKDRLGQVLGSIAAIAPALLAASGVPNVADAAHDEAVIRALGWGWTGAWRALDAPLAAMTAWIPVGTRAARAGLASALVISAIGYVTFRLARTLLARAGSTPGLGAALALVASLSATAIAPLQIEAIAPGGSLLGAALVLACVALAHEGAEQRVQDARIPLLALALGAALGYEPLTGGAAFAGVLSAPAVYRRALAPWRRPLVLRALGSFLLGLAPLGVALVWSRASMSSLAPTPFAHALGERGDGPRVTLATFARDDLGWLTVALFVGGAVVTLLAPKARPFAISLFSPIAVAAVGLSFGAPAGPTRYGAALVAALALAFVFVGAGMERLARAVANAPVPFARASAAMIVVLELALPLRLADEAIGRRDERARGLAALWDEVAWGDVPIGAVMLVAERRTMRRVLASRASGAMRGDVAVVPLFDLSGRLATRELAREPKLASFWRDLALGSAPEEFSLSVLAQSRPLALPFDVKWERSLARHLVPAGLMSSYEAEPRGQSDRRKALEAFLPQRERLVKSIVVPKDPELVAATAYLLRARLVAVAAAGERDIIGRALDDLRPFSPDDALASQVVRRVVVTKGPIEVRDLVP